MKKKVTIKGFVYKLLQFKNRRKLNPGHTYSHILEQVKAKFPDAKTSYGNINWYATKLRQDGVELPERPRGTRS